MRETIKVVFENYLKVCVFWTHAYAYAYILSEQTKNPTIFHSMSQSYFRQYFIYTLYFIGFWILDILIHEYGLVWYNCKTLFLDA